MPIAAFVVDRGRGRPGRRDHGDVGPHDVRRRDRPVVLHLRPHDPCGEQATLPPKADRPPAPFVPIARTFWIFTLPRAFGQAFNVTSSGSTRCFVPALIGATAGGIYAAGHALPPRSAAFIVESFMQAVGPKVSGLLTARSHRRARRRWWRRPRPGRSRSSGRPTSSSAPSPRCCSACSDPTTCRPRPHWSSSRSG